MFDKNLSLVPTTLDLGCIEQAILHCLKTKLYTD